LNLLLFRQLNIPRVTNWAFFIRFKFTAFVSTMHKIDLVFWGGEKALAIAYSLGILNLRVCLCECPMCMQFRGAIFLN